MKHLAFQIVNIKSALRSIDYSRFNYPYATNPIPKPNETDYSNIENIINRLETRLSLIAEMGYGCCIGIAFGINGEKFNEIKGILDNTIASDNNWKDIIEKVNYFDYSAETLENSIFFLSGDLEYTNESQQTKEYDKTFQNSQTSEAKGFKPLNIFSISKDSYLFKGANIQLGENETLNKPNFINRDKIHKFLKTSVNETISTPSQILSDAPAKDCTLAYINKAYTAIMNSDMQESDKNNLIKDLQLVASSIVGINNYNGELTNINYSGNSGQKIGFSTFIKGKDPEYVNPYGTFFNFASPFNTDYESDNKCLERMVNVVKELNGTVGYDNYEGPFTVYALLLSVGEEGVDDNCLLKGIEIGTGQEFEVQFPSTIKLGTQNIQVQITPLPRNRAKVTYTITAVPEGATGITFKATY